MTEEEIYRALLAMELAAEQHRQNYENFNRGVRSWSLPVGTVVRCQQEMEDLFLGNVRVGQFGVCGAEVHQDELAQPTVAWIDCAGGHWRLHRCDPLEPYEVIVVVEIQTVLRVTKAWSMLRTLDDLRLKFPSPYYSEADTRWPELPPSGNAAYPRAGKI